MRFKTLFLLPLRALKVRILTYFLCISKSFNVTSIEGGTLFSQSCMVTVESERVEGREARFGSTHSLRRRTSCTVCCFYVLLPKSPLTERNPTKKVLESSEKMLNITTKALVPLLEQ